MWCKSVAINLDKVFTVSRDYDWYVNQMLDVVH